MPTIYIGKVNNCTNTRAELIITHGIDTGYIVRISDAITGIEKDSFRSSSYAEAKEQYQFANGNGHFCELDL